MKGKYRNIVFVAPDPEAFVSGGNIYNLHFLKTIQTFDPAVKRIDFDVFQALREAEKEDLYLIDTFYFEDLKVYRGDLSSTYLLVHLLGSLNEHSDERMAYVKREEAMILDQFKGFISTSKFTKDYLCAIGYQEADHIVLPPAITFEPVVKEKSAEKIRALMVNNLQERKGIIELLEAIRNTKITSEQCEITIIGNDKIEPEYAKKVKAILQEERFKGWIHYIGVLPHQEVISHYESSNLYLSAAYVETFGIALQEAVAHRIPILAYLGGNVGAHVNDGVNGSHFTKHMHLAAHLEYLCFDRKRFEELLRGAWAYRKAETYTWKAVVKSFIQQLNNLK